MNNLNKFVCPTGSFLQTLVTRTDNDALVGVNGMCSDGTEMGWVVANDKGLSPLSNQTQVVAADGFNNLIVGISNNRINYFKTMLNTVLYGQTGATNVKQAVENHINCLPTEVVNGLTLETGADLKVIDRSCLAQTAVTIKQPKIDGGWSAWGEWTPCDSACDGGKHSHYRICDNPTPINGRPCSGLNFETEDCNTAACEANSNLFTAADVNMAVYQDHESAAPNTTDTPDKPRSTPQNNKIYLIIFVIILAIVIAVIKYKMRPTTGHPLIY